MMDSINFIYFCSKSATVSRRIPRLENLTIPLWSAPAIFSKRLQVLHLPGLVQYCEVVGASTSRIRIVKYNKFQSVLEEEGKMPAFLFCSSSFCCNLLHSVHLVGIMSKTHTAYQCLLLVVQMVVQACRPSAALSSGCYNWQWIVNEKAPQVRFLSSWYSQYAATIQLLSSNASAWSAWAVMKWAVSQAVDSNLQLLQTSKQYSAATQCQDWPDWISSAVSFLVCANSSPSQTYRYTLLNFMPTA